MNYLNKIILTICIVTYSVMPTLALEFDMSVDEEIRKNYNPSKLELESLPPIPSVQQVTPSAPVTSIPKTQPIQTNNIGKLTPANVQPQISKIDKSTAIRIKQGTKFRVKSNQTISDSMRVGTRISFVSQMPVTQTYVTIPQGTIFRGEIADSHLPQKSGNGGLIVVSVDSMNFKGSTVGINAKITKANHKKIFLNNIKGERKYLKSIGNNLKPGKRFYKKMAKTTSKLANGTATVLLTPITVAAGVIGYAANAVCSPVLALFSVGGRISVPAGSEFEIKVLEDIYLY